MTDITMPPEALRAARAASMNARGDGEDPVRAACLAMLNAWPGMSDIPAGEFDGEQYPRIIHLPLTESTNDEG